MLVLFGSGRNMTIESCMTNNDRVSHDFHLRAHLLRPSLNTIVSFGHQLPVEEAVKKMDLKVKTNSHHQFITI